MEYIYINCSSYQSHFWKSSSKLEKVLMISLLLLGSHKPYTEDGVIVPDGNIFLSRNEIKERSNIRHPIKRALYSLEKEYGLIRMTRVRRKTYIRIVDYDSCRNEDLGYTFGIKEIISNDKIDKNMFINNLVCNEERLNILDIIEGQKTIVLKTYLFNMLNENQFEYLSSFVDKNAGERKNWYFLHENSDMCPIYVPIFSSCKYPGIWKLDAPYRKIPGEFRAKNKNNENLVKNSDFFWQNVPFLYPFFVALNWLRRGELQNYLSHIPGEFRAKNDRKYYIFPENGSFYIENEQYYYIDNLHGFNGLDGSIVCKSSQACEKINTDEPKRVKSLSKLSQKMAFSKCFKFYGMSLYKNAWISGTYAQRIVMFSMLMITPLQEQYSVNHAGNRRSISGELYVTYADIASVAASGITDSGVWHNVNMLCDAGFCKKRTKVNDDKTVIKDKFIDILNWADYQMFLEIYDISVQSRPLILTDFTIEIQNFGKYSKSVLTLLHYCYETTVDYNRLPLISGQFNSISNYNSYYYLLDNNYIVNTINNNILYNSNSNNVISKEERNEKKKSRDKNLEWIINQCHDGNLKDVKYGFTVANTIMPQSIYLYKTVDESEVEEVKHPECEPGGLYYETAREFYLYQKKQHPDLLKRKIDYKFVRAGADSIRLLISSDNYTYKEIVALFEFIATHNFWSTKVLSIPRLRESRSDGQKKITTIHAQYKDIKNGPNARRETILDIIGE